ncbi:hypothetical protein DJ018_10560 [Phenylobacterium deserti]|uniref:O-antigen ligase domain-containing protein n=1 Tax=Phenylobacterium deserti TaxID=1914756 RepID=A0A328ADQ8_9CAUL|nr:hypothetical protein DJ018_10560 [Phenylobacterium deserti]
MFLILLVIAGTRSQTLDITTKTSVVCLIGVFVGSVVLATPERCRAFFDAIAVIIVVLSAALLFSFTLLLAGVRVETLSVGHFWYGYPRPAVIILPGTTVYNYVATWFGMMPRLSGFFREVGIFPAFACWAAGYCSFRRWSPLATGICLIASVASLSTMGLVALVTLGGVIGARLRLPWWFYLVVAPFAAFILIAVTYNIPYIGLGYKYTNATISFVERMNAIRNVGSEDLLIGGEPDGRNLAINLIAQVSTYGLIGIGIIVSSLLGAVRDTRYFFASLLPAFVIALFSQPIATEPLFFLLFISHRVFAPIPSSAAQHREQRFYWPTAYRW